MIPTSRLLKWFLPDIFARVPEQDIRDYFGFINDPNSKKSR